MYNRRNRNGEVNKLKREVTFLWLVTTMPANGKNKYRTSGKWSRKETMLWKTEHNLECDKSSLNLPGGENRKQIRLIYWKSGKYLSSWWWREKKRCLPCVTVYAGHAMWLCCSYSGDISVIMSREDSGRVRAELPRTVSQLSAWVQSCA